MVLVITSARSDQYAGGVSGIHQQAPEPVILKSLLERFTYRPGWRAFLRNLDRGQGSEGTTLVIHATVPDTYHPGAADITIAHYFPVPPAAYDETSWRRWLLDCILLVEQHEACEFFAIDGERVFAPHHGPGENPYTIYEHGTDEQRRTLSSGEVKS